MADGLAMTLIKALNYPAIGMIGTGYVGLVTAACFATLGLTVHAVDNNREKIKALEQGKIPIYEPGLENLVREARAENRLFFSTDLSRMMIESETIFIAVGTPTEQKTGAADLSALQAVARQMAPLLTTHRYLVIKSTVPVGTGHQFARWIREVNPNAEFSMVSNPEFLREGLAVSDFLNPDRVVVGVENDAAKLHMMAVYAPLAAQGVAILYTDIKSAELIKYAANGFLATKIAFVNEIANLCDTVGADIEQVVAGIGSDKRIGPGYLQPGPGYGGSCFPKDTLALKHMGEIQGSRVGIIEAVIVSNENHKKRMVDKILAACGGSIKGKTLGILGLAFKANTDDVRESSAVFISEQLLNLGASLMVYDPVVTLAQSGLQREPWADCITEVKDAYEAAQSADALVILTEWDEFAHLDWDRVKKYFRNTQKELKPVVIDLRNLYDPKAMKNAGIEYISLGRRNVEEAQSTQDAQTLNSQKGRPVGTDIV